MIYNEICKYEKKIQQLTSMGALARFVTQSRLRSKLDQLSNYICVQITTFERHVKDVKINQIIEDTTDEFSSLLDEIENISIEKNSNNNSMEGKLRKSIEQQRKIKDKETQIKLDSILSIVKEAEKKEQLMANITKYNVKLPNNNEFKTHYNIVSVDENEQTIEDIISVKSISTYPKDSSGKREGDPIADQYAATSIENRTIISVADGCSWGVEPKEAARKASRMFNRYMTRHHEYITTTIEAADYILRAFEAAHKSIIHNRDEETLFLAGTTTIIAGILLELQTPVDENQFVLVLGSIGDCKAFCYNHKTDKINEITIGNRGGVDARDPGGRLGPYSMKGDADLRNLILYTYLCNVDDIIILVTDGVHDNLDPRQLGKLPSEIGIQVENDSWDVIKNEKTDKYNLLISNWVENYITEKCCPTKPYTVTSITQSLLQNSIDVTSNMRNFMETNRGKKVPSDYKLYPGKVDHTTCLSLKITQSINKNKNWTPVKVGSPSSTTPSPIPSPLQRTNSNTNIDSYKPLSFDDNILPRKLSATNTINNNNNNNSSNNNNNGDDLDNGTENIIWDNLFGNQVYVVPWNLFIRKLNTTNVTIDNTAEKQLKTILDYSNTGSVTRFKFGEFLKGFGPTLEQCIENVNRVVSADWFVGFISANEGRKFLEQTTPGTFLIRFSGSKPGSFVLDYVTKTGQVSSVRLNSHITGGFSAAVQGGQKEVIFKSLHDLVDTYKNVKVLSVPCRLLSLPNKYLYFLKYIIYNY